MIEPLKIPKRDKGKYEYIKCGKCKQLVYEKCNRSKKGVKSCKFLHRHRYYIRYYVPNSQNKYITKTFTTRNYSEFKKQAAEFIASIEGVEFEEIQESETTVKTDENQTSEESKEQEEQQAQGSKHAKNVEPILNLSFKSILLRYADYLEGVGVPGHLHKEKDDKTIKGYLQAITLFKDALKPKGIDLGDMLITEIGDTEVGLFHDYLVQSKKPDGSKLYTNRTYNNKMNYNKAFIKYVKDILGINMVNPFENVNKKYVKQKNLIVELHEFDDLLKTVTKKNGKYEKLDRGKIYNRNHFRPFLKNAYKLALYTGERRDGIVLMKWSFVNMKDRIITLPNYKVNRIQETEKERMIPITVDLYHLLKNMGFSMKKGKDEYIICPDHANRTTVKDWISKSFTHYWLKQGNNPDVHFMHLRKTYVTIMYSQFGDKTKAVTDQNVDTILEYYLNKKKIVSQARNMSLYELDEMRKAA